MDYEQQVDEILKENENYLNQFQQYLESQSLGYKTIRKHVFNVDLYINDYLAWYEEAKMDEGVYLLLHFFDDWYIRKCAFSSITGMKSIASSLKKFYKLMGELGQIDAKDYEIFWNTYKSHEEEFINTLLEYDSELWW